jgi:hypothetical protein
MKKLLTLLIMSFLAFSVFAQSRSVVNEDVRDQLSAKKSIGQLDIQSDDSVPFCHTGLKIARECTDCGMRSKTWATVWLDTFGGWIDEVEDEDSLWVDAFNTAEYFNKVASVPAWNAYDVFRYDDLFHGYVDALSGSPYFGMGGNYFEGGINEQFLDHLGQANRFNTVYLWDSPAGTTNYDWVERQVIDTTTFNAYSTSHLGVNGDSHYSWWIGSIDPLYDLPG